MSWRVPQVTDHKIELQGLDGELRLWERGVKVFEERERAGEYHKLQNTKSSFKVSTESFGCGRKGLDFSRERERELESITGYRTRNRASRCRRRDLGVGERGRVFSTERESYSFFF